MKATPFPPCPDFTGMTESEICDAGATFALLCGTWYFGEQQMSDNLQDLRDFNETDKAIARIVPTLSDADIAADLKRRMVDAFQPILAICDEAKSKGFVIGYGSGEGPLGKQVITQLIVARHY